MCAGGLTVTFPAQSVSLNINRKYLRRTVQLRDAGESVNFHVRDGARKHEINQAEL